MKPFFYCDQVAMFQFQGITICINVVMIDSHASYWFVTKRTNNHPDEETWTFRDYTDAFSKFCKLVSSLNFI